MEKNNLKITTYKNLFLKKFENIENKPITIIVFFF